MKLSFLNILAIIILFQLVLLIIFLLVNKKGKASSNYFLAAFFFLILVNLTDGLLSYYGFYTKYPAFAGAEDSMVFLLGPVLYFYTRSIVYRNFRLSRFHLWHLLPFVLVTMIYQSYYHTQDEMYQRMIQHAIANQTLPPLFYVIAVCLYLHVGFYIFLSLKQVREYRQKIRQRFSAVEKLNLEWLSFMLWFVAGIMVLSIIYTFLPAFGLRPYFNFFFALAFLVLFIFINLIVWKGLTQPTLFAGIEDEERKYATSLADAERVSIEEGLDRIMKQEKLFLNPDLTVDTLASAVGFPAKKVSQVINESFAQNFFDYINTFRIREAERLMLESDDPKLTVLEVMYASGFNSKSSFNTVFKQKTGVTPSAFKKAAQVRRTSVERV